MKSSKQIDPCCDVPFDRGLTSQDKGDTPQYSGPQDYSIGPPGMNGRVRREGYEGGFSRKQKATTGLVCKEPL